MTNATGSPHGSIRFVLPPLAADQVPGGRDAADYSVLQKIANGLILAETLDEQAQQLISIPDVWAQVEVFRAALIEKAHPLHSRAVGEWRGLLAIFALRFSRAYDVTTQKVQLGTKGTGHGLIAILNKIKPAVTLTRRHNWDEIGLIKVRGAVAGLLVPTTLVCPGRRPPAALAGRLPWITQNRILDPLEVADVNRDEIAVLADFCARASELLEHDEEYQDDFRKRGLLSELKGTFDDFKAAADERLEGVVRGPLSERTLNLELPAQPLYPLLRDVKVSGRGSEAEPVSQALLPARPELRAIGINGILIIDPNLPQVLGARASDINVWGGTKLQLVLDEREERQKVDSEARAAGYLSLGPDDLFTTYFYRTDNVQIEAHPLGLRDALLPITPAVMMLLAPEDFPRAIELSTTHDEVIVTLRLKLSDIGGRERVYTARKIYEAKEVISGEPPTTLSLWPDFDHPDWHWHFAYYGGRLTQQFAPRMFVSMPAMAKFIIAAGEDRATRVGRAAQLVKEPMREPQLLAERLALLQTETPVELYRPDAAPEALYCDFVIDRRATGYIESRARTAAGVLLLARKKLTPSPETCAIGIDFGTVNTSVYQRIGAGGRPEPIMLKNHLILPFAADSEEKRAPYLDFLPLTDIGIPFLTVLGVRGMAAARLPIWSSFIYYVTDVNQGLRDLGTPRGSPLVFDLKWGTTLEERLPIRTFLAQVALQSLAEVVARGIAPQRVSWRFSYPEAYSPSQQADFADSAATAVRLAVRPPDAAPAVASAGRSAPIPDLTTASESLSTALYFISEKRREAPATGDLVTIDMGGLTSDVSIWHNRRLIWRNSLKLAGRHILLRYLLKNHDLIGRMADVDAKIAPLIRQVEGLTDAKRGNGIEMLMNSPLFQDAFVSNFHLVSGEPLGRKLRAVAELALLGILHYVGRTMQYCAGRSSAYQDVKDAHVAVCLGGRASLLYRALFEGNARRAQLDASMGAFRDAAPGIVAGTRQVYSDIPKHEVAFGLLVSQEGAQNLEIQADGYRVTEIILGEAVRSGDTLLKYDARTSDLGIATEWQAANLDELKAFLRSVQAHSQTITTVGLTADGERSILHAVNRQLIADRATLQALAADGELNDAHLLSESTVVEPPFIVGLRELIDLVIDPEDKTVRVQMRA